MMAPYNQAEKDSLIECSFLPMALQELLAVRYAGHLNKQVSLLSVIREITVESNAAQAEIAEQIVEYIFGQFNAGESAKHSVLVFVLIECGHYFDCIGRTDEALRLLKISLHRSGILQDENAERKAHSLIGSMYGRTCNFGLAYQHLKIALDLASKSNEPLYVATTLLNIAVLLEGMGLHREALSVSVRLIDHTQGTMELDYIHFLNAQNGIRLSSKLGCLGLASDFLRIAEEKVISARPIISELTFTYYDSARTTYYLLIGDVARALAIVESAENQILSGKSIRAFATLTCARARIQLYCRNNEGIRDSIRSLTELLESTCSLPLHKEEILRTLIQLSLSSRRRGSQNEAAKFAQVLREHLIATKHKHLLAEFYRHVSEESSGPKLAYPGYEMPPWLAQLVSPDGKDKSEASVGGELSEVSSLFTRLDELPLERKAKSYAYMVAENWAIAAELFRGEDGNNFIRVGRLASEIAVELGLSNEECCAIGMACRLRDVGLVAFGDADCETTSPDEHLVTCQHTTLGSSILGSSPDRILQLASRIAASHHEFWNGCGLPYGLRGEAIPLGARICAIAEIFIGFIFPPRGEKVWLVDTALQQIDTMAGIQIDPSLVGPLRQCVVRGMDLLAGVGHDRRKRLSKVTPLIELRRMKDSVRAVY